MEKQEKIVCAAVYIKFKTEYGREYSGEFISLFHDDENIKQQVSEFRNSLLDTYLEVEEVERVNGFITSKLESGYPRFVDAKEAYQIASYANQIKPMMILTDPPQYPDLKPEDLY